VSSKESKCNKLLKRIADNLKSVSLEIYHNQIWRKSVSICETTNM